ncbi:hypothetical protein BDZ94DRAFT_655203 [Collybia nuda]|uniref:Protein Zds1 C-terminal domain-containing protein n=1 Tax=Collybia nuda TaxID=64659 RepID=A0A9P5Y563_9AGAR|nr:hypothetical protein BDZ94DRAFT_655203 [Collybia nuda]
MATRTLQPSEYDIQREVEALRDIRRRSTTPGALIIDPDLPNQSPPSSPTYRLGASPTGSSFHTDSSGNVLSDGASVDSDSGSGTSSGESGSGSNNPADDPFHLFWVPASLHPEIAPAEFRAFLKEHARAPPTSDGSSLLDRSGSFSSLSSSSSLGRKRSMLSRQYRPAEHDGIENEHVIPLRRNRSSLYTNHGPQLTINDLQKLEELAEEASESDDPSRLRNVLRRSLSLNISPSAIGQMDDMSDLGDEADAPIIVPPPGQILRRAARTKIRKPGLPGDGGGHRFGSTRRWPSSRTSTTPIEPRTSSDISSSDHGESIESNAPNHRRRTFSDEGFSQRPDSFSEEASIFDAYARDDEEEEEMPAPVFITSPPDEIELSAELQVSPEVQPSLLEALGPAIHHPQPQYLSTPQPPSDYQGPSRTPSPPETAPPISVEVPAPPQPPLPFLSTPPSPPTHQRKEKGGKGLFKWGGDKGVKKNVKEKERESRERAEKEKETGFFGSLFGGGSKKKQEQDYPPPLQSGASARETAQALLGASKSSKNYVPPTSPALSTGIGPNSYARYPIHVERAIYRLSHIKLANPRRPLYEQVLISNLMFWYLGVINKAQTPTSSPNGQPVGGMPIQGNAGQNEQAEQEQKEREQVEQQERAEKERLERERLEKEQREREVEMKRKESGRRGSLTKSPAPGSPGAGRRAEMPVKGPQYEMQHRVMEQEYGNYSGQSQQGITSSRSASSPTGSGNGQPYLRTQQQSQTAQFLNTPPKLVQPQPQPPNDNFYYSLDSNQHPTRLPPGAMPPSDQPSRQQPPGPHSSPSPPPPSPHRSRSPPKQGQPPNTGRYIPSSSQENLILGGGNRTPGRSLSATAVPSPPASLNGKVRKGTSAHAAVPSHGRRPRTSEGKQETIGSGEEDMPLAMWQQQQRR